MTTSRQAHIARFRTWRRGRPFWGGLWAAAGGAAVLLAPLAPLPLLLRQGVAGVSGYLVGALLVAAGLLSWWQPGQRVFLGLAATGLSLSSFVTSNFGGFGLGMLLGVVGGALLVAWVPGGRPSGDSGTDGDRDGRTGDSGMDGDRDGPAGERLRAAVALPMAFTLLGGPVAERSPAESGLAAARLTMTGARFHGVVVRPTAAGPRRHLKLSMATVEITSGTHWVRGPGPAFRQRFPVLRMSGGVVMYTTRLRMRVAGVAVTFTPGFPPPLVPPAATVTGVEAERPVVRAARAALGGLAQEVG